MAQLQNPNPNANAHRYLLRGRKTACRSKPAKGITIKKPPPPLEITNQKKRKSSPESINRDGESKKKKKRTAPPAVFSRDVIPDCSSVEDYESLGMISKGSYGVVYRIRERETGEILAMKEEFDGLSAASLTEIKILKYLGRHPSVVGFKKVAVDEYDGVYVVMEYLETDLKRYISLKKEGLCEIEVKSLMKKLLEGVKFLHEKGVMHRDLKPSNVLVNNDGGELKICDFGLSARFGKPVYSSSVGTLWYRAPELLRGVETYSSAVDMWAVGCIMAELLMKEVLFKGEDERDQYYEIIRVLGFDDEGYVERDLSEPRYSIQDEFKSADAKLSEVGFDLLYSFLRYDPRKRITAECALDHAWFNEL
ncbi:hypothetical protein C2S53_012323 [Perilla frutescens var. hirtella]|uniref:Protein kinase domain-containing protein n=1 Tax=Perilla frutescens var. hirtella TaxID=608512 RepID=A0AAD4IY65_PERFH|nr:hypothetical protein C2S53_012323 [Perilla frutescens var. hirtella]